MAARTTRRSFQTELLKGRLAHTATCAQCGTPLGDLLWVYEAAGQHFCTAACAAAHAREVD